MPSTTLRHISIHVEEPAPRAFYWVLQEQSASGTWREQDRADAPERTYREAMAEGLLVLQNRIDDLDAGPRSTAVRAARSQPADEDDDDGRDADDAPPNASSPRVCVSGGDWFSTSERLAILAA